MTPAPKATGALVGPAGPASIVSVRLRREPLRMGDDELIGHATAEVGPVLIVNMRVLRDATGGFRIGFPRKGGSAVVIRDAALREHLLSSALEALGKLAAEARPSPVTPVGTASHPETTA